MQRPISMAMQQKVIDWSIPTHFFKAYFSGISGDILDIPPKYGQKYGTFTSINWILESSKIPQRKVPVAAMARNT